VSKPYPESFDHLLAAWNERDQSRIRVHLEHALAPDAEFVDPTIVTRGIDEFESNVREFRTRYPLASAARTSGIDSHHHLHRYSWHIVAEGKVLVQGVDVVETDASNKVRRVLGFFGPLPRLVD
jgi:hypothetical protein